MTLPSIGDVVDDKFRIERKLGEGGTSTIYEVRHVITDKKFALKWLAPELAANDLAVQLLFHEAKVCGRFSHPNAVQIYDICRTEDACYLLMEFLEGESLEERLAREERLSVQAACDILLPCTEALRAAHRVGIVHRDLKPSNIFLCRVEGSIEVVPKVLDFGISNYVRGESDGSPSAASAGTPLYMAPEQVWAHPADPRLDIYALGVVLYELVSGQPPFDGDDFDDLVNQIVESEPPRLDELVDVEPAFAAIVARAMARGSSDRFATMAELAAALRPYSSHGGRESSGVFGARISLPARPAKARAAGAPATRRLWANTALGVGHRGATATATLAEPAETMVERQTQTGPQAAAALPAEVFAAPSGTVRTSLEAASAAESIAPRAAQSNAAEVEEPPAPPAAASLGPSQAAPIAPPIVLPPPKAGAPRTAGVPPWSDDAISSNTPWRAEDVFMPRRPVRGRGTRIGLAAALGGALLLTLYALTRVPDVPATASRSVPRAHVAQPPPVPTAAPATSVAAPELLRPEQVLAPQSAAAEIEDEPMDPRRARAARRAARKAARKAAREERLAQAREARKSDADDDEVEDALDDSNPPKRPAPLTHGSAQRERTAANQTAKPMPLPAAAISRQDF